MDKLLLSLKEVEQVLGVRKSKLYELIAQGTLETVSIGRRRLVPRAALKEFVDRLRAEGSLT